MYTFLLLERASSEREIRPDGKDPTSIITVGTLSTNSFVNITPKKAESEHTGLKLTNAAVKKKEGDG
jgi:hypothetical protein